jgi:hypothetical protein
MMQCPLKTSLRAGLAEALRDPLALVDRSLNCCDCCLSGGSGCGGSSCCRCERSLDCLSAVVPLALLLDLSDVAAVGFLLRSPGCLRLDRLEVAPFPASLAGSMVALLCLSSPLLA